MALLKNIYRSEGSQLKMSNVRRQRARDEALRLQRTLARALRCTPELDAVDLRWILSASLTVQQQPKDRIKEKRI